MLNLAQMLFEDIIFSRLGKSGVLFIPLPKKGWMVFRFGKNSKGEERVFFQIKNGKKIKGECSRDFFIKTLNRFFLKGDIEKICRFLQVVNLQKNRGLAAEAFLSRRGCNIAKELVINFLLYRLSYERKSNLEISLLERDVDFRPGTFFLALICPRLKEVLGGYILSISYCFSMRDENGVDLLLKLHLPHLNIHRLVRDALANIGLIIN